MDTFELEARHISKRFPGTIALRDVSVSFSSGAVHAIIGKNGSGKSTLMKIFSGVYQPTEGGIWLYGSRIEHNSPFQAINNGIATVYQELSLVNDLSVGENIFLGRLPLKRKYIVDWRGLQESATAILAELGETIDPRTPVRRLSLGQKQLVEIAKSMSFNPKVLILDEPTSALSEHECKKLFSIVQALKAKGIIILYITHRLQELFEIADSVTIIRDAELIGTRKMENLSMDEMIEMMVGGVTKKPRSSRTIGQECVLEARNLCADKFIDVSFKLKKGEILGLAGMLGSGRTELMRVLFGLEPYASGGISMFGKAIDRRQMNPKFLKKLGLAFTSENRKEEGLCLNLGIDFNICLASIYELARHGKIDARLEKESVDEQIRGLSIKGTSPKALVSSISGGNQQKVVLGNWLNTKPRIVLMDEPSRGIDVKAKQQVFEIIWKEAARGVSFVFVSSELEEIIDVCDRILVIRDGTIVEEFDAGLIATNDLYSICMGTR
ncbi:MAG: sugar ABC transporter ATP-binding protein [Rectinemataceae bacterium]